jgi:predicted lipid-binding transport protein (Tim44 family)
MLVRDGGNGRDLRGCGLEGIGADGFRDQAEALQQVARPAGWHGIEGPLLLHAQGLGVTVMGDGIGLAEAGIDSSFIRLVLEETRARRSRIAGPPFKPWRDQRRAAREGEIQTIASRLADNGRAPPAFRA